MDFPAEVRSHDLLSGERLLWSSRPEPGLRWSRADWKNILPGCVFTGFALFWTTAAFAMTWAGNAPWFFRVIFPLFGLPFILVGLLTLAGGPVGRARPTKYCAYAITDRRVIVVTEHRERTVTPFELERLELVSLEEGRDGVGTIKLTISRRDMDRLSQQGRLRETLAALSLDSIPDAASVYRTLEHARAARKLQAGEIDP